MPSGGDAGRHSRMKAFRNPQHEVDLFRARTFIAALIVLAAFGVLAARLVWLQIVKHEELHQRAEAQRTALVPVTANRGLIRDRNGIVWD